MSRIIVALGGNAILTDDATAEGQIKALQSTSEKLVKLVEQGHQLVISHGNGPQVGNLFLQNAAADSQKNPALPLDSLVAMTQGSIGYWLQSTLKNELIKKGFSNLEVVSVITRVVVDENDDAFANPTKPIGPFYDETEVNEIKEMSNQKFVEDAGRGYRRVVPSPKPINIVEYKTILSLINQGVITISVGGGGVPVLDNDGLYEGIEAVIDKDLASAKLAQLVEADYLIILTGVDNVYINYNKPDQEKLKEVTVSQLREWMQEGQFAPGSMLPKIEAAIEFVNNSSTDGKAIITSIENIESIFNQKTGTVISK